MTLEPSCQDCCKPVWRDMYGNPTSRCAYHLDVMQWRQRCKTIAGYNEPRPVKTDYRDNARKLGDRAHTANPVPTVRPSQQPKD